VLLALINVFRENHALPPVDFDSNPAVKAKIDQTFSRTFKPLASVHEKQNISELQAEIKVFDEYSHISISEDILRPKICYVASCKGGTLERRLFERGTSAVMAFPAV
jgi:hypothetical protein